jgi:hypothetical protein
MRHGGILVEETNASGRELSFLKVDEGFVIASQYEHMAICDQDSCKFDWPTLVQSHRHQVPSIDNSPFGRSKRGQKDLSSLFNVRLDAAQNFYSYWCIRVSQRRTTT